MVIYITSIVGRGSIGIVVGGIGSTVSIGIVIAIGVGVGIAISAGIIVSIGVVVTTGVVITIGITSKGWSLVVLGEGLAGLEDTHDDGIVPLNC